MTVASSKTEGLAAVAKLVADYDVNRAYNRSRDVDELSIRTWFVDKLFEALGWDVTGSGPGREVVFHARHRMRSTVAGEEEWDADLTHEQLDARADTTDVPDYGFYVGLELKFYVEAKRPFAGVGGKSGPFQVKSYGWNQGLPFSVLTDFENLRVFRTRQRPDRDRPQAGLLEGYNLTSGDYVARWDALWALLSKEQVAAGHAAVVAHQHGPRGGTAVDEAFLRDLEGWREQLGADLLAHHEDLETWQLEEATQRVLDRLVFVRVVEDRDVEPNVVLRRYARVTDSYRQLCAEFRRLDTVYNGQLFAHHWSEDLEVSDHLVQRLIASLYAVDGSPYRFDTFQADFLGKVYERFLGKRFELTAGGTVRLIDKPEVRHAGGVYYTPRWVVDHMVDAGLGPLLEGRTPRQVAALNVVDPACGSGTFLLGVLDHLIRWHELYYDSHPVKDRARHYVDAHGRRRLTSDFKGEIIVNNVFGVDVDPRAVEVAQMSLYLRVLEEETAATLGSQPRLFEGARLPSLARNVRAGNSLIEDADVPPVLLGDLDLRRRINPFEWRDPAHGFGDVFAGRGGFDVVIGNPPYTRVQEMRASRPEETRIVEDKYRAATAGFDIATLFTERGLALLAPPASRAPGGVLVFITSRTFTETDAGAAIRRILADGRHVAGIIDFRSGRVFPEAGAYTVILKLTARPSSRWRLTRVPEPPAGDRLAAAIRDPVLTAELPGGALGAEAWSLSLPTEDVLLTRLAQLPTLGDVTGGQVFQGVITGNDDVYRAVDVGPDPQNPQARLVRPAAAAPNSPPLSFERSILRPVYAGKGNFQPFHTTPSREWVVLPYAQPAPGAPYQLLPWAQLERDAPHVARWLRSHEVALRTRRSGNWTEATWYAYSRPQNLARFAAPKIMVPAMLDRLCATYDTGGHYFVNVSTGGYGLGADPACGADPEYVAALLNSRLLSWVLKRYSRAWRGGWFEARKGNLVRLPVALPDASAQQRLVRLYREVEGAVSESLGDPDDEPNARLATTGRESFDHEVDTLYALTFAEKNLIREA